MARRSKRSNNGQRRAASDTVVRKSFPAPQPLATPTDLKPAEVKAVTEAINPLVADAFALYVKTKNFHWHLAGPRFRDYHLMFDEHAEQILQSIDPLAERVRRLGGTTIRSITHISQLQAIADDNDDFVPADEMVRRLMEDNLAMGKRQREAIETCEDHRDSVSANVIQEILDQTEKRTWFLFESLQRSRDGESQRSSSK